MINLKDKNEEGWEAHEFITKTYDMMWNRVHIMIINTTYQYDLLLIKWNPFLS